MDGDNESINGIIEADFNGLPVVEDVGESISPHDEASVIETKPATEASDEFLRRSFAEIVEKIPGKDTTEKLIFGIGVGGWLSTAAVVASMVSRNPDTASAAAPYLALMGGVYAGVAALGILKHRYFRS